MIIFSEDMGKQKEGLAQKKFHSSTTRMSSKAKENNANPEFSNISCCFDRHQISRPTTLYDIRELLLSKNIFSVNCCKVRIEEPKKFNLEKEESREGAKKNSSLARHCINLELGFLI
jgi:hypothetical protein